jgi:hypothetical protein
MTTIRGTLGALMLWWQDPIRDMRHEQRAAWLAD